MGIIDDNGRTYDPVLLPKQYMKDGIRVLFIANIAESQGGIHMWGTIIDIIGIEIYDEILWD